MGTGSIASIELRSAIRRFWRRCLSPFSTPSRHGLNSGASSSSVSGSAEDGHEPDGQVQLQAWPARRSSSAPSSGPGSPRQLLGHVGHVELALARGPGSVSDIDCTTVKTPRANSSCGNGWCRPGCRRCRDAPTTLLGVISNTTLLWRSQSARLEGRPLRGLHGAASRPPRPSRILPASAGNKRQ